MHGEDFKNRCGPEIFYREATPKGGLQKGAVHSVINTSIEDKHLETFMAIGLAMTAKHGSVDGFC